MRKFYKGFVKYAPVLMFVLMLALVIGLPFAGVHAQTVTPIVLPDELTASPVLSFAHVYLGSFWDQAEAYAPLVVGILFVTIIVALVFGLMIWMKRKAQQAIGV